MTGQQVRDAPAMRPFPQEESLQLEPPVRDVVPEILKGQRYFFCARLGPGFSGASDTVSSGGPASGLPRQRRRSRRSSWKPL